MTQNTGSKLVLGLVGMALGLGMVSWWYRYEAAHRVSQFWGPDASRLIAESVGFEAEQWGPVTLPGGTVLGDGVLTVSKDLSKARGQAHLRHALMSDRNYVWNQQVEPAKVVWKWRLRFHEGQREVRVVLADAFDAIGRLDPTDGAIEALACEPMAVSLEQYFRELKLISDEQASASTPVE